MKRPTIEELEARNIPDSKQFFEIQEMSFEAYSESLNYQKDSLWLLNGYSLKPNALVDGFEFYKDLIMKKGDGRNEYIYCELKPKLQKNLAKWLGHERGQDIALGTNATTFITQALSETWGSTVKVLTTDQEFYGTTRFLNRLKEIKGNLITEVSTADFETLGDRLYQAACEEKYDYVIMSHVYFKSGNVLDGLGELIHKLKEKCDRIIIDGSCAFGNISVKDSLGDALDKIYYIGGIYKFIGAGEGFGFMSLPKDCKDRPVITGWLFGDYHNENHYYSSPLFYEEGAERYCTSTVETSIWVRVNTILEYFESKNFTIEMRNKYTRTLQDYMVENIEKANLSFLSKKNLKTKFGKWRPLQTCYDLKEEKITAQELCKKLEEFKIYADYRGSVLRLCPAIYHTVFDIDSLVEALKKIDN